MKKNVKLIVIIITILVILGGIIMFNLLSKKYDVYVNRELGDKYHHIRKHYREGQTVKIILPFVFDASYKVSAKEKDVEFKTSYKKNFYIYKFKMPNHDVHLSIDLRGDMLRSLTVIKYSKTTTGTNGPETEETLELTEENELIIDGETFAAKPGFEEKINKLVEEEKMDEWNFDDGTSLDGARYRIEIHTSKYDLVVTSDNFPEDKENVFRKVEKLIIEQKADEE